MQYEIIHLPKKCWKGTIIPIQYTTDQYYEVVVTRINLGFSIEIVKKDLAEPLIISAESNDYPDRLYADHWGHASASGVLVDGKLIAAIETDQELWSNRLRITELWVEDEYRGLGLGRALVEKAKSQAKKEHRRAVILETQSCNVNAIDFYLHQNFQLIGLDTCCYSNHDIKRKEVRLEFGWFPVRNSSNCSRDRHQNN